MWIFKKRTGNVSSAELIIGLHWEELASREEHNGEIIKMDPYRSHVRCRVLCVEEGLRV